MTTSPILIVGAGPSGLVLALSLRKNGIPVRIIDKEKQHRVGERGAGVMPRSLELHNILGTLEDVLKVGTPIPTARHYQLPSGTKISNTFNMSPHVEPTPQCPYLNPVMLGQNHHEQILRSHLQGLGCHIEFGTELKSFEQHEDYVVAHIVREVDGKEVSESVKSHWLVGTDGAHSVVRKQLGLSFLGETRTEDPFVIGDIVVKGGLEQNFWHIWGDSTENLITLRPSGQDHGVFTIAAIGKRANEKSSSGRDGFVNYFYELTGRKDIIFGELIWMSFYRPNIRMVDKFHRGRVFIAGDAAHCHSPTGGQGMNSSIQDSFNLGWKLALVEKGLASSNLLETYDEERLPVITQMLIKTTDLLDKTLIPGADTVSGWLRAGELHQLGVNCRASSIVIDQTGGGNLAYTAYNASSAIAARGGDRAPDAPGLLETTGTGEETSLFRIFGASYHTILIFAGNVEEHKALLSLLEKQPSATIHSALILPDESEVPTSPGLFHQTFVDKHKFAYEGYKVPTDKLSVVVVRPDGVIGARVDGVRGVEDYFDGIFI